MFSISDLLKKYESYSDEDLLEIYSTNANYSNDANTALDTVIQNRGGLESLLKRIEEKNIVPNEIKRITIEINNLGDSTTDVNFLKTLIKSDILSKDELDNLIEQRFAQFEANRKDKTVTSRTWIVGSIAAGVAILVVGGLFGLFLMYMNAYHVLIIVGIFFLCYGIIKLITKQSTQNAAILVLSVLATIGAALVGFFMLNTFGIIQ